MHKYERWVIYPLLFLALLQSFVGLKFSSAEDQSNTVATFDQIKAKGITITNDQGDAIIYLGTVVEGNGGAISVWGPKDRESPPLPSTYIEISAKENEAKIDLTNTWNVFSKEQEITIQSNHIGNFIGLKYPNTEIFGLNLRVASSGTEVLTNNTKGDRSVSIGYNKAGHGSVSIFDKYGESYTSYSFDKKNAKD